MIEKIKTIRFALSLITGNIAPAELQQKVINEASGCDDGLVTYEDLDEANKKQCDEAVAALEQLPVLFDDIVTAKAIMARKYYLALCKQGFRAPEALTIAAHQTINISEE